MNANLATEYLREHGETLAEYDNDGHCGELANVLQMATPNSKIVSVSGVGVFHTTAWTYHTVVMLDGIVHDAWRKRAMPLRYWLQKFNCEWPVEISIDGEEVYEGLVSELPKDLDLETAALAKASTETMSGEALAATGRSWAVESPDLSAGGSGANRTP